LPAGTVGPSPRLLAENDDGNQNLLVTGSAIFLKLVREFRRVGRGTTARAGRLDLRQVVFPAAVHGARDDHERKGGFRFQLGGRTAEAIPDQEQRMIELELEIPLPGFKPVILRLRLIPWFM
jgi:hypothetical protein